MKKIFDNQQEGTAAKQCSEKTCATCFENRGCMYEQYPAAATNNIHESPVAKQNEFHFSAIQKQV